MLLGLHPIQDSWLSYQINDMTFELGENIDNKIAENTVRDKNGNQRYHHNIHALLGFDEDTPGRTSGPAIPDIEHMAVADDITEFVTEGPDTRSYLHRPGVIKEDGSVEVDFDPNPGRGQAYRNPLEWLDYRQRGREPLEIIREPVRYEGPGVEIVAPTAKPTMWQPSVTPKSQQHPTESFNPFDKLEEEAETPPEIPADWGDQPKQRTRVFAGGRGFTFEDGKVTVDDE
jgi:hypothetical protein